jgi:hypothetical protein
MKRFVVHATQVLRHKVVVDLDGQEAAEFMDDLRGGSLDIECWIDGGTIESDRAEIDDYDCLDLSSEA